MSGDGKRVPPDDPVSKLADVIEIQITETKKNTQAFVEIKSEIVGLREALMNGGFKRLEERMCSELEQARTDIDNAVENYADRAARTAAQAAAEVVLQSPPNFVQLPKMGWVAMVLFFLVMLVALGVRIPELVQFFKGTGG